MEVVNVDRFQREPASTIHDKRVSADIGNHGGYLTAGFESLSPDDADLHGALDAAPGIEHRERPDGST